jgi:hypothetical protein
LDTSFVSTDNINNPRTMNAVYMLGERLEHAKRWGKKKLTEAKGTTGSLMTTYPKDH